MAIPGEKAIQMVRRAHTQAAQMDIAVTAVVVDQSGRMIALGRMDRARPITVEIALNKAYTAASFQQPTKELAESSVGIAVTAAVVDEAGVPIVVGRMDGAAPQTTTLAVSKAYTAAAFHVATADLVAQARQPWLKSLVVAHRGRLLPAAGGLVIFDGITIIGAIGVAGGSATDQDVLCCQAAFSVLETGGH